jgi:hypothetical protein
MDWAAVVVACKTSRTARAQVDATGLRVLLRISTLGLLSTVQYIPVRFSYTATPCCLRDLHLDLAENRQTESATPSLARLPPCAPRCRERSDKPLFPSRRRDDTSRAWLTIMTPGNFAVGAGCEGQLYAFVPYTLADSRRWPFTKQLNQGRGTELLLPRPHRRSEENSRGQDCVRQLLDFQMCLGRPLLTRLLAIRVRSRQIDSTFDIRTVLDDDAS